MFVVTQTTFLFLNLLLNLLTLFFQGLNRCCGVLAVGLWLLALSLYRFFDRLLSSPLLLGVGRQSKSGKE